MWSPEGLKCPFDLDFSRFVGAAPRPLPRGAESDEEIDRRVTGRGRCSCMASLGLVFLGVWEQGDRTVSTPSEGRHHWS